MSTRVLNQQEIQQLATQIAPAVAQSLGGGSGNRKNTRAIKKLGNDLRVRVPAVVGRETVQELKQITTVQEGDIGVVQGTGNMWIVDSVSASGSTWVPADGFADVLDFGAVEDGTSVGTDNSAAFTEALSTHSRVVVVNRTGLGYRLENGITIDGNELYGVGSPRLLFSLPDDNTDGITVEWAGLINDIYNTVDGFYITGAGDSDTGDIATDNSLAQGRDLIRVKGGERWALRNLRLSHSKRDLVHIEGSVNSEWSENPNIRNVRGYYAWRDGLHIGIPSSATDNFINELLIELSEFRVCGRTEARFSMAGGGSSKIEGVTFIACNFDVGARSTSLSSAALAAYSRETAGSVYIDAAGGGSSLSRLAWFNVTWEDTTGYATNGVEDPIGFSSTGIVSSMSFQDCSVPTGFNPANSNRYSRAGHPTYDAGYITHLYELSVSRLHATGDFITGQLRLGTPGAPDAASLLHLIASGTSCRMILETSEGGGYAIQADSTNANPVWRHAVNSGELFQFLVGGLEVARISNAGIGIGDSSVVIRTGSGDPEGVVSAVVGSLFLRDNGGASTTLYVKESGTGNTGWVAK